MQVNNKIFHRSCLLSLLALAGLFSACGKSNDIPPPPKSTAATPAPTPVAVAPKEKAVYVYSGDRYRDIFTPVGGSTSYSAEGTFDPTKLAVRGIIFSPRYKSAVLTVSGNGTYFVNGNRIFDVMGKNVKGFTARVMIDRVVVMNESDNTFEIKIRNTDEKETKTL